MWICGDRHVGNLGPIANAEDHTDIQIRGLDQTVIGNPAHDLIRLGLCLATAARGSNLPGVTTANMLENMMEGYEQAFGQGSEDPNFQHDRPECVRVDRRARNCSQRDSGRQGHLIIRHVIPLHQPQPGERRSLDSATPSPKTKTF